VGLALPGHPDRPGSQDRQVLRVHQERLGSPGPPGASVWGGPPGPPGPPGPVGGVAGLEYVRTVHFTDPGATISYGEAKAPAGKIVLGGGFEVSNLLRVMYSIPSIAGDAWQVTVLPAGEPAPTEQAWAVWAVCARPA